ncbi:MAG: hypothetical protein ACFCD0_27745 [Gemmataceae bacterium]
MNLFQVEGGKKAIFNVIKAIHACIGYSYCFLKILGPASGEKAPNPSEAGIIASEAGNAAEPAVSR